jgi:NAD(P)-dependent dehydrogenase (short-subunit alcohol dehydrogenase family)
LGRLDGKCIVVTGAGRGLGAVLTRRFVEEGAKVIAASRNGASLAKTIEPLGANVVAVAGDLGEPDNVDRVFAAADRWFGKLDVLINNAAIYDAFKIDEGTPERMRATVHANLLAPMLCIRAATPLLRKTGGGDIINITSESAHNPYAFLTAYAATKAGLEMLSTALRTELRPDRIRVTTLRLGIMDDPNREMNMDQETMTRFLQQNVAAIAASGATMMQFESVAHSVIDILTLPADAAYDIVELRPRT